jgi:hypothetical protein
MRPDPDPDREDDDGSGAPEALDPEDVDIEDDEYVREIDENRYVVSADEPIGAVDPRPRDRAHGGADEGGGPAAETGADADGPAELTDERVHDWLKAQVANVDTAYAFDVTARFDDTVGSHRLRSDDVVSAFESLLLWNARRIDDRTAAESVLGILLTESNLAVRYPPGTLAALVEASGLGPEDTIADLLAATGDREGLVFPPPGADVRGRDRD